MVGMPQVAAKGVLWGMGFRMSCRCLTRSEVTSSDKCCFQPLVECVDHLMGCFQPLVAEHVDLQRASLQPEGCNKYRNDALSEPHHSSYWSKCQDDFHLLNPTPVQLNFEQVWLFDVVVNLTDTHKQRVLSDMRCSRPTLAFLGSAQPQSLTL